MKENIVKTMVCIIAFVAMVLMPASFTEAKCNACSPHGIACVDENTFLLCFDGKPDTSKNFTCPENTVCSQTQFKCIPKGDGPPACNPSEGCANCDGVKMFACTSRTTFAQCNGKEITENTGKCPDGLICDSNSNEICVDECHLPNKIECDKDAPF